MEIFLETQCKSLVESCILGLIFGVGYDIIRIIHVLLGIQSYTGGFSAAKGTIPFGLFLLCDLVYMLSVTGIYSVFLYHSNYGQFRLYLAIGCIGGFLLYYHTVGRTVMRISESLIFCLKWLINTLILTPIRYLVRYLALLGGCIWKIGPVRIAAVIHNLWLKYKTQKSMRAIANVIKLYEDS